MARRQVSWSALVLGTSHSRRTRVSQSLLAMPPLLLIHALLVLAWRQGVLPGATVAWYVAVTLVGCVAFYAAVRSGLGERARVEPSLSAPQMVFAMLCTASAYALCGPYRSALLCLMPLILCFGIFALESRASRALANFGIVLMGGVMAALAAESPQSHPALVEAASWAFLATSMTMMQVLSDRLSRLRSRLTRQKNELSQALERIRLLATRDTLTGLLNRRAAMDELRRAAGQAARHERPLVVALVDLDRFKQINDGHGHQTGDRVLQAFADVAQRELRAEDCVSRWGGEEFLFILPDTSEDEACACLERVLAVCAEIIVDGLPTNWRIGFSAGVACCLGPADLEPAIERADRAMYRAKLAGRGRIHRAQPPETR
ncbi:GGDEF domain-containing protein [Rubrivivax sp. JA1024]|nr:GGDEF domain-containing protein [Rubrivivax sp. JA1024]